MSSQSFIPVNVTTQSNSISPSFTYKATAEKNVTYISSQRNTANDSKLRKEPMGSENIDIFNLNTGMKNLQVSNVKCSTDNTIVHSSKVTDHVAYNFEPYNEMPIETKSEETSYQCARPPLIGQSADNNQADIQRKKIDFDNSAAWLRIVPSADNTSNESAVVIHEDTDLKRVNNNSKNLIKTYNTCPVNIENISHLQSISSSKSNFPILNDSHKIANTSSSNLLCYRDTLTDKVEQLLGCEIILPTSENLKSSFQKVIPDVFAHFSVNETSQKQDLAKNSNLLINMKNIESVKKQDSENSVSHPSQNSQFIASPSFLQSNMSVFLLDNSLVNHAEELIDASRSLCDLSSTSSSNYETASAVSDIVHSDNNCEQPTPVILNDSQNELSDIEKADTAASLEDISNVVAYAFPRDSSFFNSNKSGEIQHSSDKCASSIQTHTVHHSDSLTNLSPLKATHQDDQPVSPTSVSSVASSKRLEWDNGADIGYASVTRCDPEGFALLTKDKLTSVLVKNQSNNIKKNDFVNIANTDMQKRCLKKQSHALTIGSPEELITTKGKILHSNYSAANDISIELNDTDISTASQVLPSHKTSILPEIQSLAKKYSLRTNQTREKKISTNEKNIPEKMCASTSAEHVAAARESVAKNQNASLEPSANTNQYLCFHPVDKLFLQSHTEPIKNFENVPIKLFAKSEQCLDKNDSVCEIKNVLNETNNYTQNCSNEKPGNSNIGCHGDVSKITVPVISGNLPNFSPFFIIDGNIVYDNLMRKKSENSEDDEKFVFLENSNAEQLYIDRQEFPHIRWYPMNENAELQDIKNVATQTAVSFLKEKKHNNNQFSDSRSDFNLTSDNESCSSLKEYSYKSESLSSHSSVCSFILKNQIQNNEIISHNAHNYEMNNACMQAKYSSPTDVSSSENIRNNADHYVSTSKNSSEISVDTSAPFVACASDIKVSKECSLPLNNFQSTYMQDSNNSFNIDKNSSRILDEPSSGSLQKTVLCDSLFLKNVYNNIGTKDMHPFSLRHFQSVGSGNHTVDDSERIRTLSHSCPTISFGATASRNTALENTKKIHDSIYTSEQLKKSPTLSKSNKATCYQSSIHFPLTIKDNSSDISSSSADVSSQDASSNKTVKDQGNSVTPSIVQCEYISRSVQCDSGSCVSNVGEKANSHSTVCINSADSGIFSAKSDKAIDSQIILCKNSTNSECIVPCNQSKPTVESNGDYIAAANAKQVTDIRNCQPDFNQRIKDGVLEKVGLLDEQFVYILQHPLSFSREEHSGNKVSFKYEKVPSIPDSLCHPSSSDSPYNLPVEDLRKQAVIISAERHGYDLLEPSVDKPERNCLQDTSVAEQSNEHDNTSEVNYIESNSNFSEQIDKNSCELKKVKTNKLQGKCKMKSPSKRYHHLLKQLTNIENISPTSSYEAGDDSDRSSGCIRHLASTGKRKNSSCKLHPLSCENQLFSSGKKISRQSLKSEIENLIRVFKHQRQFHNRQLKLEVDRLEVLKNAIEHHMSHYNSVLLDSNRSGLHESISRKKNYHVYNSDKFNYHISSSQSSTYETDISSSFSVILHESHALSHDSSQGVKTVYQPLSKKAAKISEHTKRNKKLHGKKDFGQSYPTPSPTAIISDLKSVAIQTSFSAFNDEHNRYHENFSFRNFMKSNFFVINEFSEKHGSVSWSVLMKGMDKHAKRTLETDSRTTVQLQDAFCKAKGLLFEKRYEVRKRCQKDHVNEEKEIQVNKHSVKTRKYVQTRHFARTSSVQVKSSTSVLRITSSYAKLKKINHYHIRCFDAFLNQHDRIIQSASLVTLNRYRKSLEELYTFYRLRQKALSKLIKEAALRGKLNWKRNEICSDMLERKYSAY